MITTPINERVMNKLRPEIAKLLTELKVQYAEYGNDTVKFNYLDLEVSIKIKTKLLNHEQKK